MFSEPLARLKNETKIKKIFESKGAPWWFGGPRQLAYSANREDRLCTLVTIDLLGYLKSNFGL